MATGDIRGNTGTIKSTASTIRDDAKAYGVAAQQLFETVEALKNTWTSEDGNAYIAKITSYRETFEALQKKLDSSAEALETAAVNYEQTIKNNTIS
ncbi:MAG: WXG100 family type VII secretion target [Clostridia bacterium]|nr:WXG100 family type VII secretion target [Clostridia bacterium]